MYVVMGQPQATHFEREFSQTTKSHFPKQAVRNIFPRSSVEDLLRHWGKPLLETEASSFLVSFRSGGTFSDKMGSINPGSGPCSTRKFSGNSIW